MNQETIIARINQLSQEAEQLRNNLAATIGAIQDNQYWLEELKKGETLPEEAQQAA